MGTKELYILGVFNAPVPGLYLLTVYGQTVGPQFGSIHLMKNDQALCYASIGDDTTWNTASCTAIAELIPGDSVRVTGSSDRPITIAWLHSGFAGHLIQEYF